MNLSRNIIACICLPLSLAPAPLFLSCSDIGTEPHAISLKLAEQIVLSDILGGNDSGRIVYELPTEMESGTVVRQRGPDSTEYRAPTDSWFFFVDDKAGWRWAHPCRYVFVACADGKLTVFDEEFPPNNIDSLRVVTFR